MSSEATNPGSEPKPTHPTRQSIIVAIDGPAGAGKSTVARHLAQFFGLLNLETGAMYRAFALKALNSGIALDDVPRLLELSANTTIHLEPTDAGNLVFLDGEDVTGQLREADVTDGASRVSVHPQIRSWMVRLQQELGEQERNIQGGVVMEGRDIGTVVFPNADVKIFLDAAAEVRGMRRYDQMPAEAAAEVQPEEVVRELRARDERDRNRKDSPLKPAEDAVRIDSTQMTLEQVVARAEGIVAETIAAKHLSLS
jgi:cytidylate kinase